MSQKDIDHLDDLLRHIEYVRERTTLLGKRLIGQGKVDDGRVLIARGLRHDLSKFEGIEWKYLHQSTEVPEEPLRLAIEHHALTNDHHPQFWNGIHNMPDLAIAEMVCDWAARSAQFLDGGLRAYIRDVASKRFHFSKDDLVYQKIMGYVDLLCDEPFRPINKELPTACGSDR